MKASIVLSALFLTVAFAAVPDIAHAKKAKSGDGAVQATTADAFATQVEQLRKEMTPTGRYADMTADDRARVEKNLEVITRLFEQKGEFASMNDADKVTLVNAQEEANAILTNNDDDRLICSTRRPTGSNFKQKQCMTAKQARELRENSRDGVERYRRPDQPALPGGAGSR